MSDARYATSERTDLAEGNIALCLVNHIEYGRVDIGVAFVPGRHEK